MASTDESSRCSNKGQLGQKKSVLQEKMEQGEVGKDAIGVYLGMKLYFSCAVASVINL